MNNDYDNIINELNYIFFEWFNKKIVNWEFELNEYFRLIDFFYVLSKYYKKNENFSKEIYCKIKIILHNLLILDSKIDSDKKYHTLNLNFSFTEISTIFWNLLNNHFDDYYDYFINNIKWKI